MSISKISLIEVKADKFAPIGLDIFSLMRNFAFVTLSILPGELKLLTNIKEILEIDNNAQILDWNTLVENFRNLIQN